MIKNLHITSYSGAIFSDCKKYRYLLWRCWDNEKPMLMFIGLNPSVANELDNDRTISRLIYFAKIWDYGGFYITNLFAYIEKDSSKLHTVKEPIGELNDMYIQGIYEDVDKVVFMWGTKGKLQGRCWEIIDLIPNAYCFKLTKHGHPQHPLYLKGSSKLTNFRNHNK